MSAFKLKPTHAPVKTYYETLFSHLEVEVGLTKWVFRDRP